jgi:uncharacterized protein (TIGR02246 family)
VNDWNVGQRIPLSVNENAAHKCTLSTLSTSFNLPGLSLGADMRGADEAEIRATLDELSAAWHEGDAAAYGARYQAGATFTNVFGDFYVGREEFDRRHDDVFRGIFKGTTLTLEIRKLRFVRADVAVVDIVTAVGGAQIRPPGVDVGADGTLRSSLLMVLTKEHGRWEIAAYHNVWRSARP